MSRTDRGLALSRALAFGVLAALGPAVSRAAAQFNPTVSPAPAPLAELQESASLASPLAAQGR